MFSAAGGEHWRRISSWWHPEVLARHPLRILVGEFFTFQHDNAPGRSPRTQNSGVYVSKYVRFYRSTDRKRWRAKSAILLQYRGALSLFLSETSEPISRYTTKCVMYGQCYARPIRLPSQTKSTATVPARCSFPIPHRVESWVGSNSWLHTRTVLSPTITSDVVIKYLSRLYRRRVYRRWIRDVDFLKHRSVEVEE